MINDMVFLLGEWINRKKLAIVGRNYLSPSSGSFDSVFKAEIEKICPSVLDSEGKKDQIIDFIKENKRRPSRLIPAEKKLNQAMRNYLFRGGSSFDSSFKDRIEELCPSVLDPVGKKDQLIDFIKENKRRPSRHIPIEKKSHDSMRSYINHSSGSFDPVFKNQIDELLAKVFQEKADRTNNNGE